MSSKSSNAHQEADPNSIKWTADKKACIFKPRGLNIVWGNDPQYWVIPKEEEKPAQLNKVCWLEVTGSVDIEFGKKYQIGFKVSVKSDAYGLDQAPVFMSAKIGKKGKTIWKRIKSLSQHRSNGETIITVPDDSDERFEINFPPTEFYRDNKLYFGLYEVWSGKWKGGLMIHEAFVQEVA